LFYSEIYFRHLTHPFYVFGCELIKIGEFGFRLVTAAMVERGKRPVTATMEEIGLNSLTAAYAFLLSVGELCKVGIIQPLVRGTYQTLKCDPTPMFQPLGRATCHK
jgi:hypothetical protein